MFPKRLSVSVVAAALTASSFSLPTFAIEAAPAGAEFSCVPYKRQGADGTEVKRRTVCADVAALDHMIVYNRFGSFNPFGMIFALRRDLSGSAEKPGRMTADTCDGVTGAEAGIPGDGGLAPGKVRLKDCKRPRPLVLRANVGDVLHIRLTNLLTPEVPDLSKDFCRSLAGPGDYGETLADSALKRTVRAEVSEGTSDQKQGGEVMCGPSPVDDAEAEAASANDPPDWPRTRGLSIAIQGLRSIGAPGDGKRDQACVGLRAISIGEPIDCYYEVDREGTYFFSSKAAPAGGEGIGGSITHGLFGAVVAEQKDTAWYRSQVSRTALDAIWTRQGGGAGCQEAAPATAAAPANPHRRLCKLDYDKNYAKEAGDFPELRLTKQTDHDEDGVTWAEEIVHSDLNAIVYRPKTKTQTEVNFREFSVFFHDELKSFYTRNFDELAQFDQLAGVRDGFAINYGASGMGTMLLANRKKIGPAGECAECLYEEFFLQSWANGDPALLEQFPDDPSNVHHSYLNDRIVFRNFHAGPKETHVFHLHAHQWFAGNDANRGAYLDSQTVAPQQGFTYNIYGGGLNGNPPDLGSTPSAKGAWGSNGSGNRNRTIGDSIFHCHLYPHFAQGMWELWRVHDVLEDGTRKLPDGQADPGLSTRIPEVGHEIARRVGTFERHKLNLAEGVRKPLDTAETGTPIPAIVPLPDEPLPPLPTYPTASADKTAMPGYPFYIPGKPGHRAPQAPLDLAVNETGQVLDGGLPRHVVLDGAKHKLGVDVPAIDPAAPDGGRSQGQQALAKMLALADFSGALTEAKLDLIPYDGTAAEKAAMAFHYNGALGAERVRVETVTGAAAPFDEEAGGYQTVAAPKPGGAETSFPSPAQPYFHVNGSAPKAGAPFADPCGASKSAGQLLADGDPLARGNTLLGAGGAFYGDPALRGFRRYDVSAVQLDLVTNRAGWHDPQARINVLTSRSAYFKDGQVGADGPISPVLSAKQEPFFFRAASGECIEFRHTNELPKDLERDDFQVKTPTDTIGQHIHLVKFDVMTADGSANGWNYEDGTFAPDEVAARLCAAREFARNNPADQMAQQIVGTRATPEDQNKLRVTDAFCADARTRTGTWWRQAIGERSQQPFQTTVQRWFADPILSKRYLPADAGNENLKVDRTLRTVFTHDHFGPSSIQQHGFYSALLIEPQSARVCAATTADGRPDCDAPLLAGDALTSVAVGDEALVGARKIIDTQSDYERNDTAPAAVPDPTHPDYREFALAIADFATLYDPRDHQSEAEFTRETLETRSGGPKGLAMLACEARYATETGKNLPDPARLADFCGSAVAKAGTSRGNVWASDGNIPPAWVAAGKFSGLQPLPPLLSKAEADLLLADAVAYRRKSMRGAADGMLAKPVAPPERPESISVDHHDPYLVNYRGEPLPLRIGTDSRTGSDCALAPSVESLVREKTGSAPAQWTSPARKCSIDTQIGLNGTAKAGVPSGDFADAFLSTFHRDPSTPILESYSGERTVVRLIQGAQEVQHTLGVEGFTFPRNIDHDFPTGMRPLEVSDAFNPRLGPATLSTRCGNLAATAQGRPEEYGTWLRFGANVFRDGHPSAPPPYGLPDPDDAGAAPFVGSPVAHAFWKSYEELIAGCDNVEGRITAQEVGISEHFEFGGRYRQEMAGPEAATVARSLQATTDYLYHFGTVDALWNGAWGLNRVYKDREARYLSECPPLDLACAITAGQRLVSLSASSRGPEAVVQDGAAASQIVACPIDAPKVTAIVAAMETSRVWPNGVGNAKGTPYGSGNARLNDGNGLMFALIDPARLFPDAKTRFEALAYEARPNEAQPGSRHWQNIGLDRLRRAITETYGRPEPLVLRLAANDCLTLFVINGLTRSGKSGGLADFRGDAPMPKITPLNVESDWGATLENETNTPERFDQHARLDATPSARLGLTIPLASLDHAQTVPLPFGYNDGQTLAPARCSSLGGNCTVSMDVATAPRDGRNFVRRDDSIDRLVFYAGRSAFRDKSTVPLENAVFDYIEDKFGAVVPLAENEARDQPRERCLYVNILGKLNAYCAEADFPLRAAKEAGIARHVESLLSGHGFINWTPYAFGALPIRSSGDMIGHGVHGLFGALIVEPQDAQLPASGRTVFARPGSAETLTAMVPHNNGRMWEGTIVASCIGDKGETCRPGSKRHRIREFVLFYQDGLNLRDSKTKNLWHPSETPELVADCQVCNDSYDLGDQGVNYRSDPFFDRLRGTEKPGQMPPEAQYNLNAYVYPKDFFLDAHRKRNMPALRVEEGDEVVIRVIHPGGRARQRSFATIGQDYDDLFPGFGFPHAALLAPGKGVRASLSRPVNRGCFLWHDGTATLNAGGTWGLIDVVPKGQLDNSSVSSCADAKSVQVR